LQLKRLLRPIPLDGSQFGDGEQKGVASEPDRSVAQTATESVAANDRPPEEIIDRVGTGEENYRVIIEAATDAVISMDEGGVILLANPATKRILAMIQPNSSGNR
jgi:PAS domain-containing protein